jgi:hydrogenase maturation protease
MSLKVIAIGNRLMGDDGAAIHVAEKLSEFFKEKGIELIIGETDFDYCLSKIEEGDFIIIIDAAWFGAKPGTVAAKSIKDVYKLNGEQSLFSMHGYGFIKALEIYHKSIDGMVIGIEGQNFDYSLSMSRVLIDAFGSICSDILDIVLFIERRFEIS